MPEFSSQTPLSPSSLPDIPAVKCRACGKEFSLDRRVGTANRNHCPHCLASLHVDEKTGDRSSTCHGLMQAVGLTFKYAKKQKYPRIHRGKLAGELMLVHCCEACGKISVNRLAADDDTDKVLAVFKKQQTEFDQSFLDKLAAKNISLAQEEDHTEIHSQLLGNSRNTH